MLIKRILSAVVMFIIAGAASAEVRITPQDSGVKVRLRGISAVSADVAWASGREGTVLRTVDGGKHWQIIKVPDADELDFRDVEGFDAQTAVILSIGPGEASRVYRTEDGGKSWQLTLQNHDPRAFFDCMAFEGERGWMLGDPVESRFQIHATINGGRNWTLLPDGPDAAEGEAAFAGSGTCIAVVGDAQMVATGGATMRLHVKNAGNPDWVALEPVKSSSSESKGYFSIAASNAQTLLVGGDYKTENEIGIAAATRTNVTDIAALQELPPPHGYRSGAACARDQLPCVAVGPSGVDRWDGSRWQSIGDTGYDAIDFAGNIGWASGDAGRIARIDFTNESIKDAGSTDESDD